MTGASHPAYETPRLVTSLATVVLAENPDPMTLEGTNTWLLRAAGTDAAVVVDPGPDDPRHLDAVIAAAGEVQSILLTHGHPDHSAGARALHERTGAPVRALDPAHRLGGEGLTDGQAIAAAGVEVRVLGYARAHRRLVVVSAHGARRLPRRRCSLETRCSAAAPRWSPTRTATSATISPRCDGCRHSAARQCFPDTGRNCRTPGAPRRATSPTESSG